MHVRDLSMPSILKLFLTAAEKKVSLSRNKKLHYTLVLWFFDQVGKFLS